MLTLLAALCGTGTAAPAASVADFYKGKTIKIVIGLRTGSTYDAYARTLGRYMGRHIPGHPAFLPQNLPGAGSLKFPGWLSDPESHAR